MVSSPRKTNLGILRFTITLALVALSSCSSPQQNPLPQVTSTSKPTVPSYATLTPRPTINSHLLPVPIKAYYVATDGSDANPGTFTQPWRTILKATNSLKPGDTALVLPGTYNEQVNISASGITLQAEGKVITKNVYISGDSNTFRGFTVTDPTSEWGIRTSGNHNLIEENEIYNTHQDGIWFFGSYNIFRGNYIHDILDSHSTSTTHVDCFQTWGWDWDTTNDLFERNLCINNHLLGNNALVMIERKTTSEVRDITFRNNIFVIYLPVYASFNINREKGQSEISNIAIVNNTIVNMSQNGNCAIQFMNITNASAINNLFINYGNENMYHMYLCVDPGNPNIPNVHNNAVYNVNGISPYESPYSGDVWMKNPLVINLSGLDFHLQSDSPLIDAGYNLGNLVTDDFNGVTRPQGAGYDIGAYEFVAP